MSLIKLDNISSNDNICLNMENFNLIFDNLKKETLNNLDNIKLFAPIIKFSENLNNNFQLFDKIFQKYKYYSMITSEHEYNIANKFKSTYKDNIKKLLDLLIQDNLDKPIHLKDILLKLNTIELLKNNKEILLQNNKLNVSKIIQYDDKIDVKFSNTNCIITNINHNEQLGHCEINPYGDVRFYCNHLKCEGKCIYGNNLIKKDRCNFFCETQITHITKKYLYSDISVLIPADLIQNISNDKDLIKLILDSLDNNNNSNDIAKFILYICDDKYKFTTNWYEYEDNKKIWVIGDKIDLFIRTEVIDYYKKIINLIRENNDIDDQVCNHIIKTIRKITDKLGNDESRKKIIDATELLSKESNVKFKNNLDNTKVIHFTNGLYKIDGRNLVKHKTTHYLTLTAGYPYIKKYSNNVDNLLNYLANILPNKDVREFFLTHLSKCLCNDIHSNNVTFLIGENKKLTELIKLTFGDYEKNKRICITDNYENITIPLFITNMHNLKEIKIIQKTNTVQFINLTDYTDDSLILEQDFMLLLLEYYYK